MLRTAVVLSSIFVSGALAASGPDTDVIAHVTGLQPDVKNGVGKVSVPRSDLTVTVDGVKMSPFQGFTSWAAFTGSGAKTVVMGDMTLAEDEVSPAMDAALANGLEVTALHNHFSIDRPRILFMHIAGTGTTEHLATAVRKVLDAIKDARKSPTPAESFGGPAVAAENSIDAKALEAVLGMTGQAKDGMAKFVFAKKTKAHGMELGPEMGINTWAAFAGSPQAAVVDGDFAMLESELQPVLKALRAAHINVVAIHSHMTHEDPRIMFLHYWGKGPADDLAHGIQAARATQK
ncbi:MAG: DUF1259 domain-containing protein [Deltaproteobacteria bacterium]|nr:MAG: DUF1259 domain-containing protein [Deltaproteobacteria bacterium]